MKRFLKRIPAGRLMPGVPPIVGHPGFRLSKKVRAELRARLIREGILKA